jgi:hypothetical protein
MHEAPKLQDGAQVGDAEKPMQIQWELLRPTQGAIGYVQVLEKKETYLEMPTEKRWPFIREQAIKVVRGPSDSLHIIDHHHWARAWFDLGLPEATVIVLADFSELPRDLFIEKMAERGWLHPFDKDGCRISVQEIPDFIGDIPDDVFQSLAAFLRMTGTYDNPGEFNAKFAWADFLRRHIKTRAATVEGFARMLADAVSASRSPEATELPGFIPRSESTT